jgi:hypothetical protein
LWHNLPKTHNINNIVVITGSPRKGGNGVALAEAFIKKAEEKGLIVTRFDATKMEIKGCTACETCYKTGRACSFDDDFNTAEGEAEPMEGIRFSWRHTYELLEWTPIGEVFVPLVHALSDIHKTDGIARAEALADKF